MENRKEREINRLIRQRSKPKSNLYLVYVIFIISMIYMIDEIASQIGMLMKTEIANDLFAKFGESSVGALDLLGVAVLPFQIFGLLYRPLADRYGRKIFLVINTFGMGISLFLIYLSNSVWMYFIGALLIQFFIPHDMHVVYIMEVAPDKHRAKIYSSIKFIATIAVMLIPILRDWLVESSSQWRNVYFIPALIALAGSLIALFFIRETDVFIDSRLKYLNISSNEETKETEKKSDKRAGLLTAFKNAIKNKQLRWLYIVTALVNIGYISTINYQVIMSYGYAKGIYGGFAGEIMNLVSIGPVTKALMLFPVGSALSQLLMGFISDAKDRKLSAITMAGISLVAFLGFYFGASNNINEYVVGILCGCFIGSYYALNDTIIMMVGESAPTNLRSSTMSAQFIVTAVGVIISYAVSLPLMNIFGNSEIGIISFGLLVPGYILALIALCKKTVDTKSKVLE